MRVLVGVCVGVFVGVVLTDKVTVGVIVGVGVSVLVTVGVGVTVLVTLGVGVGWINNGVLLLTSFHPVSYNFVVVLTYRKEPVSIFFNNPISRNVLKIKGSLVC